MKRIHAILLLALFLTVSLTARERKNEWGLSYSQLTLPQGAYVLGGVFGAVFSLGNFTFENMVMPGGNGPHVLTCTKLTLNAL